jgi:hypothetical protein
MSEPMDLSWRLLKGFYFDPEDDKSGGKFRYPFGSAFPPGYRRPIDKDSRVAPDGGRYLSGGSRPRHQVFNRRMALNKPHNGEEKSYAGVNLSNVRGERGFRPILNDDSSIRRIAEILAHEHGHSAIHDNILEAIYTGEMPRSNFSRAHEIGAYNLQYPGGRAEQWLAEHNTLGHSHVDADTTNPPRPIINTDKPTPPPVLPSNIGIMPAATASNTGLFNPDGSLSGT